MQRLIFSSLAFLLAIAATYLTVQAQTRTVNQVNSINIRVSQPFQSTPFHLVFLAYRGHFRDWGIPSYDAFLSAYGQEELVKRILFLLGAKQIEFQSRC
jgi:hypothetical protein